MRNAYRILVRRLEKIDMGDPGAHGRSILKSILNKQETWI
jgi:hypothetical protein